MCRSGTVSVAEKLKAADTTIRWFGLIEPETHSQETRLPMPIGEACSVCGGVFIYGEPGYSLPHMSEFTDEGDFVYRPYHQPCLMKVLGLGEA